MSYTKEQIEYGNKIIEYSLCIEERKSLAITVLPDTSVNIKAPMESSHNKIVNKIKTKMKWIDKQQRYFKENYKNINEKQYISGETHFYLGRQYRLKINQSINNCIKLKNGYFVIDIRDKNSSKDIKNNLENWYYEHALKIFEQRLNIEHSKHFSQKINLPKIKIRKMKKRWGSYTKNNEIILNIELIKAPLSCIDYIILHELCHSQYFSHNSAFYELLYTIMPDWQKYKNKLEELEL
jgi:predicted metal-dependent hydrolase